jgi:hypothetical protein
MTSPINGQKPLRLLGGLVQPQRLVVPVEAVLQLPDYRHACRLAWKLRRPRNLTYRTLAELTGAYASHVSDYFSVHDKPRELPARWIPAVEAVVGNTVISQWLEVERQRALEELGLAA